MAVTGVNGDAARKSKISTALQAHKNAGLEVKNAGLEPKIAGLGGRNAGLGARNEFRATNIGRCKQKMLDLTRTELDPTK